MIDVENYPLTYKIFLKVSSGTIIADQGRFVPVAFSSGVV